MKKVKKKLSLALVVVLISLNTSSLTAFAEPTLEESNLEQPTIESIERDIQLLDKEIETSMIKVEDSNNKIIELDDKISSTIDEISITESNIEKSRGLLGKRVRQMYKSGYSSSGNTFTYLTLIFESDGFMDMVNSIYSFSKIIKMDNKLIDKLMVAEDELNKKKNDLENSKIEIEDNKKLIEEELSSLEVKKDECLAKLTELREKARQEEEARARELELELERARAVEEENIIISRAPQYDSTILNISEEVGDKADIVINEAFKYLGVPYVWGGTSPNGFDCSGYMQYIYRSIGVNLPRVSESQQFYGQRIQIGDIKPGDLVFWGTPAYHVGMYIGKGQFIHAPQTGDVVKIQNLNFNSISSISRVID